MTSPEDLIRTLAERYNLTHVPAAELPGDLLICLQADLQEAKKQVVALRLLAESAAVPLEPIDTFAIRAHDAIQAKATPGEGVIHGIAREQAETIAERERQLMALMRDVHALIGEHYQALPPSSPDDAPRLLETLKTYLLDLLHCEVDAQREFIRPAIAGDDDLTPIAHEIHALLPNGYKGPLPPDHYFVSEILEDMRSFLRDYGQTSDLAAHLMAPALRDLTARYDVPKAPLDTLAKRLVAHLVQMEADAAEAHSAARALGVEVKDLVDVAKTMAKNASAIEGRAELWRSSAKNLNTELREVRRMVGASVTDDLQAHMRDFIRQRDTFQANAVDALDRLAKVEAKLQAINEALPADLRHSDDLAAAVRTLVLTAETRYGQWDELAKETAPAVQTVAALRYALESRSMRLALARELYDADDNLLELLETADAHQMTEALLATLATNRAAPTYPPLPRPSALARTLEGPAKVAYFNHSRRAGRIEAIGDDLIRFYPVEGDPVTLNATRRDLEVYHLTADELATDLARVEARKTPPTTTPPDAPAPDIADDDLPF